MAKTISFSKEDLNQMIEKINIYFSSLDADELIAHGAIGLGVLLVIVGMILL